MDSSLLFRLISCERARSLYAESKIAQAAERRVSFAPPEIEREALKWFNGGFSHPLSNKTINYKGFEVTIDRLSPVKNSYELSKLMFQIAPNSAAVKDLALSVWLLKKRGLEVKNVYIYTINKEYIRNGEIDYNNLFIKNDVSGQVYFKFHKIEKNIENIDRPGDGTISKTISREIKCDFDFFCQYARICFDFIPEYSVLNMAKLRKEHKLALISQNILLPRDIPDNLLTDYQRIQANCDRVKKAHIEKERLRQFISKIAYPAHFLDFEAINYAIPPFNNLSPFSALAFQFSLYILKSPKSKKARYEFLADHRNDPRNEIAEKLCEYIGGFGSVIAFGAAFERSVIKELAGHCPEYRDKLLSINSRIIDLMIPFEKRWYYHHKMRGSYSLKNAAPAIDKNARYESGIKSGMDAMENYFLLFSANAEKREEIRNNLLNYCDKDAEYLVRIFKKLSKIAEITDA